MLSQPHMNTQKKEEEKMKRMEGRKRRRIKERGEEERRGEGRGVGEERRGYISICGFWCHKHLGHKMKLIF